MTAKEVAERERRERRRMPPHHMCWASGEYCGGEGGCSGPRPRHGTIPEEEERSLRGGEEEWEEISGTKEPQL